MTTPMRMKANCPRPFILLFLAYLAASQLPGIAAGQSMVELTIDRAAPGTPIPPDFVGFSFETGSLHYNHYRTNAYFFDSSNTRLLTFFQNLGIKNLRVGGNSVDRGYIPEHGEIDALFRFVKAAHLKVVYSLRLANGDAAQDADTAKYVWVHYRDYITEFAIGNEANSYNGLDPEMTNAASYLAKWNRFASTVSQAVPTAKLGGPDNGNGATTWVAAFVQAEKADPAVDCVFSHYEPGGPSRGKTGAQMIEEMLSPTFATRRYPDCQRKISEVARAAGMSFQFTEANSHVATPASKGANHSFATALFSLDFLHWWAAHGCRAIDFHTGLQGFNSALHADANGGYQPYPLGYGIAAFSLGGQGTAKPLAIENPAGLNLAAYAVAATNGDLFVTIINREHGPQARDGLVKINAFARTAAVVYLTAPDHDVTATNSITLGGATIDGNGPWAGQWLPLDSSHETGCLVPVGAASAAIVKFTGAGIIER